MSNEEEYESVEEFLNLHPEFKIDLDLPQPNLPMSDEQLMSYGRWFAGFERKNGRQPTWAALPSSSSPIGQ